MPQPNATTAPACSSEVGIAVAEPIAVGIATGLKPWQRDTLPGLSKGQARLWLIALTF